jgi:hypothetical protein
LNGDIESHASHGRRITNSKGEYIGLVAHEEGAKFSHNNQELGGFTLQRQKLDTLRTCLLMICYLVTLFFGEVNIMLTRIELVVDVIKSIGAPSWLNLFFNGPKYVEILDNHDAKITIALA